MRFDLGLLQATLERRPTPATSQERDAAVAAILRRGDRCTEALLIQRTQHRLDPWSGHMALPGGRKDADDATLLHTATRETFEEIGVDLRDHELLGPLAPLEAMARGRSVGFSITPFVFSLRSPIDLRLDESEVQTVVWAPLDALARGEHAARTSFERDGLRYEVPAFDVAGRIVWGLTYRILVDLLNTADAERPVDANRMTVA